MVTSVKRSHRSEDPAPFVLSDESLTIIATIATTDVDALSVFINNSGNVLDQFQILGISTEAATNLILFSASVDFTSPAGILIGTSGDLTVLADGGNGWFLIYPKGFHSIIVAAARASGANTSLLLKIGKS